MKRREFAQFSSGVVRATTRDLQVFELEENTWSAHVWHEKKAVVTNLGVFIFEVADVKAEPKFWAWRKFNMILMKKSNEKVEANLIQKSGKALKLTKGNMFVLQDKEGLEVIYAVN